MVLQEPVVSKSWPYDTSESREETKYALVINETVYQAMGQGKCLKVCM